MFFNALPGLQKELQQVSAEMERILPQGWNQGDVGPVIKAIMEGRGKGYRPSLLLLMAKFGPDFEDAKERLYTLGALVEYVHMASLIHDDIIDDSRLRRGSETIQSRFGKEAAVFAGDMMLGRVMSLLLQKELITSGVWIGETIQDMCRGEITQSLCRYKQDVTKEEYYENIFGKTASMFVTTCKIGGYESGCKEEVIEQLGKIGLHLGYLFQIRDDLLDFMPSNKEDGKPVRMDFREGVLTLPVIFSLKDDKVKEELKELILCSSKGELTEKMLDRLDELIRQAGGFEATVREAGYHKAEIESLLASLPQEEAVSNIRYLISLLTLPELG